MSYDSVDALQHALTDRVFGYANDSKKAAGRALGTIVEMVAFYLLKSWNLERCTAIERRVPEYGNPDITHNVEYTLHPSSECGTVQFTADELPITSRKIVRELRELHEVMGSLKTEQLLSSGRVLRNACTIAENDDAFLVAYLANASEAGYMVDVRKLTPHPYAVIECKRVGVEEGARKGPQTIEKAKQGAYVARTVSSLQKFRLSDGSVKGLLEMPDGQISSRPYADFLGQIIASNDADLLRDFTLTVGVVSNHGNWFTSSNHNKELKVLAQSYDWLLFLTDHGLSEFVQSLILQPQPEYEAAKEAFQQSYTGRRGINVFTKKSILLRADSALRNYFRSSLPAIESWFNVISPGAKSLRELRDELMLLSDKNWSEILG